MSEKLQKVLARAGLGSRREIERWIVEGRIHINNRVATLGDRVSGNERILVDSKPLALNLTQPQVIRVIAYHKPVGVVCSRKDEEGRPTVFNDFPKLSQGRWILVGRLDVNTSGLLLVTTDGELANRLMHPKYQIEREYGVRIYGDVNPAMLQRLQRGVELEDGIARFETIVAQGGEGRNQWFIVTLHEGRNREVRRLWESQGVQINRLVRDRFGPVALPRRLKKGGYQELSHEQVQQLCELVHLSPQTTDSESRTSPKTKYKTKSKTKIDSKTTSKSKSTRSQSHVVNRTRTDLKKSRATAKQGKKKRKSGIYTQ